VAEAAAGRGERLRRTLARLERAQDALGQVIADLEEAERLAREAEAEREAQLAPVLDALYVARHKLAASVRGLARTRGPAGPKGP
jgi:septal ring factor EnvC (AmiA/AmiB activator)